MVELITTNAFTMVDVLVAIGGSMFIGAVIGFELRPHVGPMAIRQRLRWGRIRRAWGRVFKR